MASAINRNASAMLANGARTPSASFDRFQNSRLTCNQCRVKRLCTFLEIELAEIGADGIQAERVGEVTQYRCRGLLERAYRRRRLGLGWREHDDAPVRRQKLTPRLGCSGCSSH